MKNIVLFLSISCLILGSSFACASDSSISKQLEILKSEINTSMKEKNETRHSLIKVNIDYIESKVLTKIDRLESKLQNYTNSLHDSENGVEVQYWSKKIDSTKKKIKDLNELIFGIEMLKLRIAS